MKKLVLLFFIVISPIFAVAGDSSKLFISGYVPVQADIRIKMNDNGKVEVSNFSSSQLRVEKINRMPASVRVTAP